jgi:hypothetical protein
MDSQRPNFPLADGFELAIGRGVHLGTFSAGTLVYLQPWLLDIPAIDSTRSEASQLRGLTARPMTSVCADAPSTSRASGQAAAAVGGEWQRRGRTRAVAVSRGCGTCDSDPWRWCARPALDRSNDRDPPPKLIFGVPHRDLLMLCRSCGALLCGRRTHSRPS